MALQHRKTTSEASRGTAGHFITNDRVGSVCSGLLAAAAAAAACATVLFPLFPHTHTHTGGARPGEPGAMEILLRGCDRTADRVSPFVLCSCSKRGRP